MFLIQKITNRTGRVRLNDYQPEVQEVMELGRSAYRTLISLVNAYPDAQLETRFAQLAWDQSLERLGYNFTVTREILKYVCCFLYSRITFI